LHQGRERERETKKPPVQGNISGIWGEVGSIWGMSMVKDRWMKQC